MIDSLIITAIDGVLNIITEQVGLNLWEKHKAKKKLE